jgi:hypothetical protein
LETLLEKEGNFAKGEMMQSVRLSLARKLRAIDKHIEEINLARSAVKHAKLIEKATNIENMDQHDAMIAANTAIQKMHDEIKALQDEAMRAQLDQAINAVISSHSERRTNYLASAVFQLETLHETLQQLTRQPLLTESTKQGILDILEDIHPDLRAALERGHMLPVSNIMEKLSLKSKVDVVKLTAHVSLVSQIANAYANEKEGEMTRPMRENMEASPTAAKTNVAVPNNAPIDVKSTAAQIDNEIEIAVKELENEIAQTEKHVYRIVNDLRSPLTKAEKEAELKKVAAAKTELKQFKKRAATANQPNALFGRSRSQTQGSNSSKAVLLEQIKQSRNERYAKRRFEEIATHLKEAENRAEKINLGKNVSDKYQTAETKNIVDRLSGVRKAIKSPATISVAEKIKQIEAYDQFIALKENIDNVNKLYHMRNLLMELIRRVSQTNRDSIQCVINQLNTTITQYDGKYDQPVAVDMAVEAAEALYKEAIKPHANLVEQIKKARKEKNQATPPIQIQATPKPNMPLERKQTEKTQGDSPPPKITLSLVDQAIADARNKKRTSSGHSTVLESKNAFLEEVKSLKKNYDNKITEMEQLEKNLDETHPNKKKAYKNLCELQRQQEKLCLLEKSLKNYVVYDQDKKIMAQFSVTELKDRLTVTFDYAGNPTFKWYDGMLGKNPYATFSGTNSMPSLANILNECKLQYGKSSSEAAELTLSNVERRRGVSSLDDQ